MKMHFLLKDECTEMADDDPNEHHIYFTSNQMQKQVHKVYLQINDQLS